MPTALITGANSGIGLAAAIELGRRDWNVAITARDPGRGEDAIRTSATPASKRSCSNSTSPASPRSANAPPTRSNNSRRSTP